MTDRTKTTDSRRGAAWLRILGGLAILGVAGGLMVLIFSTEPEAVRETATRRTAMLVSTRQAEAGTFRPTIRVMGTVVPAREVMLRPRVEGEVVNMSADFVPGGVLEAGDPILQIDPADYEIALRTRESELQRARAALTREKGRREVARRDFALIDEELSPENRALVLREPQFLTAQAAVRAAKAAMDRAQLDLERTELRAPFRAKVLERRVNLGSQASPQSDLARLVDVDRFWIESTVPQRVVNRLGFPEGPEEVGVEVTLHNDTAWPTGVHRTGHLLQRVGSLDPQTRLARVLVEVTDPLALEGKPRAPRLLLGAFVSLEIPLMELTEVVRLNRDHLHPGDTVWVMSEEGTLEIREVTVEFRDREFAYIREGLTAGEAVVTSPLATVKEGARLRTGSGDETGERP